MRGVLRAVLWMGLIAAGAAVFAVVVFLDDAATLAASGAPTPDDVGRTRSVVHQIRDASRETDPTGVGRLVTISEAEARSMMKVAGRLAPGLRGEVHVRDGHVDMIASLPVPWPGGSRWLNARAVAPAFFG